MVMKAYRMMRGACPEVVFTDTHSTSGDDDGSPARGGIFWHTRPTSPLVIFFFVVLLEGSKGVRMIWIDLKIMPHLGQTSGTTASTGRCSLAVRCKAIQACGLHISRPYRGITH
jgi:hypothetical protein